MKWWLKTSLQNKFALFSFPALTIKIGDKKLYFNRDHLMEVSQFVRKILIATFEHVEDKYPPEIEVYNKDPTRFSLFLRHTLLGFDGLILPGITLKKKFSHMYVLQHNEAKIRHWLLNCLILLLAVFGLTFVVSFNDVGMAYVLSSTSS